MGEQQGEADPQATAPGAIGAVAKQGSQVGAMGLGRGRSRPLWRDASGESGLCTLSQAV